MTKSVVQLDIVIPIFNEEVNILELKKRLTSVCDGIPNLGWRVLYVDDGSSDESLEIMLQQHREDPRFTVLELSRNFGHQPAITAGLSYVDADIVVMMDGDLQDPPEVIPDLIAKWKEGAQIVLAKRRTRGETGLRRFGIEAFHKLYRWVSDLSPTQTGVFGLMDRQVVMEFNQLPEKNRFIPGLRDWLGFECGDVVYDRADRAAGVPKQSLPRLFKLAMDAIFSFSYKPLRVITLIGLLVSVIGFTFACFFITRRLLGIETAQTGFTTLVTLILFFGGLQLFSIGIVGEYIGRIYDEAKKRPLFILKKRYGFGLGKSKSKSKNKNKSKSVEEKRGQRPHLKKVVGS